MAQKTTTAISPLHDPRLKRIRAKHIITRMINGYNRTEIAEELGIHPNTVKNSIRYAKETGLLDSIEKKVLADLAPLAVEVYKKKLIEDEDAFVAKDVFNIITKLGDRQAKTQQITQTFTIEDYIKSRSVPTQEISVSPLPPTGILIEDSTNENDTDSGE